MKEFHDEIRAFVGGPWETQRWSNLARSILAQLHRTSDSPEVDTEIAEIAAANIRSEFPDNGKRHWKKYAWTHGEFDRIVDLILQSHDRGPSPDVVLNEPVFLESECEGFSRWVLMRMRKDVPQLPGVYLIAINPSKATNRHDANVIYIGQTERQTLRKRLSQFEVTATRGADGHSGGWSYWTKIHQDSYKKRVSLFETYCSWIAVSEPKLFETECLFSYKAANGRFPCLNKM